MHLRRVPRGWQLSREIKGPSLSDYIQADASLSADVAQILLLLFSRSVVSDSLWSHGLQRTRLPCPSPPPGVYSNSWSLSRQCHPNHRILCRPLLLLPSIFPSIRVFSNVSALRIRWPKYWSFSISPSNEYSGSISFRIDWFDLAVQRTLKSLLQHHTLKPSILRHSAFFVVQLGLNAIAFLPSSFSRFCWRRNSVVSGPFSFCEVTLCVWPQHIHTSWGGWLAIPVGQGHRGFPGCGTLMPTQGNSGQTRGTQFPFSTSGCFPPTSTHGEWAWGPQRWSVPAPINRGGPVGDKTHQSHSLPCSTVSSMSLFTVQAQAPLSTGSSETGRSAGRSISRWYQDSSPRSSCPTTPVLPYTEFIS